MTTDELTLAQCLDRLAEMEGWNLLSPDGGSVDTPAVWERNRIRAYGNPIPASIDAIAAMMPDTFSANCSTRHCFGDGSVPELPTGNYWFSVAYATDEVRKFTETAESTVARRDAELLARARLAVKVREAQAQ